MLRAFSWEREEALEGTHKAGITFPEVIFPGFGNALGKHITCLSLAGLSLRQLPREGWPGIEPGRRNPVPCVWKRQREVPAGSRNPWKGAGWVEAALPQQPFAGGPSTNTFQFSKHSNGRSFPIPGQVLWPCYSTPAWVF